MRQVMGKVGTVLVALALVSGLVVALGFGVAQSERHAEERAQAVLAGAAR
jgi:cytochrome bd-type quinol oxidase subunit 1